jgi:hypothetical protein
VRSASVEGGHCGGLCEKRVPDPGTRANAAPVAIGKFPKAARNLRISRSNSSGYVAILQRPGMRAREMRLPAFCPHSQAPNKPLNCREEEVRKLKSKNGSGDSITRDRQVGIVGPRERFPPAVQSRVRKRKKEC